MVKEDKKTINTYKNVIQLEDKRFLPVELSAELRNYYESTYGKLDVDGSGKISRVKIKRKVRK